MDEPRDHVDRIRAQVEQNVDLDAEWDRFTTASNGPDAGVGGTVSGWTVDRRRSLVMMAAAALVALFLGTTVFLNGRDPETIETADDTVAPITASTTAAATSAATTTVPGSPASSVPDRTTRPTVLASNDVAAKPATSTTTTTTTTTTTPAPVVTPAPTTTTTTTPPVQSSSTTTTSSSVPTGLAVGQSDGSVSYQNLPVEIAVQPLNMPDFDLSDGVAVGPLGVVALAERSAGQVVVARGRDGEVREIAIEDPVAEFTFVMSVVAYGPGDVVYLVRYLDHETLIQAVPLSGPNKGKAVASAPAGQEVLSDLRRPLFGHIENAIINRSAYARDGSTLIDTVDAYGEPLGAGPIDFYRSKVQDETTTEVVSDSGGSWRLSIERGPGAASGYRDPPPAAWRNGGVFWTALNRRPISSPTDPTVAATVDANAPQSQRPLIDEPSDWVVAFLEQGNSVAWYSIPDGWQVVAVDEWGLVVVRTVGGVNELGLLAPVLQPATD